MNISKYFGYQCDSDEFVPVDERVEPEGEEVIPFFDHDAFESDNGVTWEEFFFSDDYQTA